MWLTDLLATFHILFAILWLGGGVMFGLVIGPRLAQVAPTTSREFFVKVGPSILRFFLIVPTLTILFGLLLVYNMINGDWSMLSTSSSWGLDVSLGMLFAISAFLVGEVASAPALKRVITLMTALGTPGGPTPDKIPPAIARARQTAMLSLVLLLLTLTFMVGAGFY